MANGAVVEDGSGDEGELGARGAGGEVRGQLTQRLASGAQLLEQFLFAQAGEVSHG